MTYRAKKIDNSIIDKYLIEWNKNRNLILKVCEKRLFIEKDASGDCWLVAMQANQNHLKMSILWKFVDKQIF